MFSIIAIQLNLLFSRIYFGFHDIKIYNILTMSEKEIEIQIDTLQQLPVPKIVQTQVVSNEIEHFQNNPVAQTLKTKVEISVRKQFEHISSLSFNLTTNQFMKRLGISLIPFSTKFNLFAPDLYGPLWITNTLAILLIFIQSIQIQTGTSSKQISLQLRNTFYWVYLLEIIFPVLSSQLIKHFSNVRFTEEMLFFGYFSIYPLVVILLAVFVRSDIIGYFIFASFAMKIFSIIFHLQHKLTDLALVRRLIIYFFVASYNIVFMMVIKLDFLD